MPGPDLAIRELGVGGGGGVRSLKMFSQFGPKVSGGGGPLVSSPGPPTE